MVERLQRGVVEGAAGVDHDDVEHPGQRAQHVTDRLHRHPFAEVDRRGQHRQPLGVPRQQRADPAGVDLAVEAGQVGQGVRRGETQQDGDVAAGHVEVDQAHGAALVGQRGGQVGGHQALADPALDGEEGDDQPRLGRTGGHRRRRDAGGALGQVPGPRHGADQPVDVGDVDHGADAGAEGLGQHRGVDVAPDQQHGQPRPQQPLLLGEAGRIGQGHRGPEDHDLLVRVCGEVPVELLERAECGGGDTERLVPQVHQGGVLLDHGGHDALPAKISGMMSRAVTPRLLFTLDSWVRSAKARSPLREA